MNVESDTHWVYTYHGRLQNYGVWKELVDGQSQETGPFKVDQVQLVIDKLSKQPFTRQAQMITWMPNIDNDCYWIIRTKLTPLTSGIHKFFPVFRTCFV